MSKVCIQSWGLILDITGVVLLAIGALDKSPPTWDDLENKSTKTNCIFYLSWFGVILAVCGFILQLLALYL